MKIYANLKEETKNTKKKKKKKKNGGKTRHGQGQSNVIF
jgi:hypothetical protein